MSHITGGGFIENIPRVLPTGLGCTIDASTWALPEVFGWLMQAGNVAPLEMMRTFNCGIGMVVVVGKDRAQKALEAIKAAGEDGVRVIGEVVEGEGVTLNQLDSWGSTVKNGAT
jgi:phosphoribosylamine--glycine ligase / phosphoribosylformylglycinamidine cyclo-ligase